MTGNSPATICPWTNESPPSFYVGPSAIEPGILPLVAALNAAPGVHTFASCQGHGGVSIQRRHKSLTAYVAFFADHQATSVMLPSLCRELSATRKQEDRLRFCWVLEAWLHPNYDFKRLAWVIRLASLKQPTDWFRRPLVEDVARVATMVATSAACLTMEDISGTHIN